MMCDEIISRTKNEWISGDVIVFSLVLYLYNTISEKAFENN